MAVQEKIELFYNMINKDCYSTVQHYKLIEGQEQYFLLNRFLRLQDETRDIITKPIFWLSHKNSGKWSEVLTGLWLSGISINCLVGYLGEKEHLLLLEDLGVMESLKVTVFPNHYPFNKKLHPMTVAKKITSINI